MLKFFISCFLLTGLVPFLQAEIIETQETQQVLKYAEANSLVLFNITDTLYIPSATIARHQWRDYLTQRIMKVVTDQDVAQGLIKKLKNDIVRKIPKRLVEKTTPSVIDTLQDSKISVLGITEKQIVTSYADNFGLITSGHLKSLGIDLEKTLAYFPVAKQKNLDNYAFAYGIIFTNKKPIGQALLSFLQDNGYVPSKIIMIDNSRKSLEMVEAALAEVKISFTGLRYGHADAAKKEFDPIVGIIEFLAFIEGEKIISDEQAQQIRKDNADVDYEAVFETAILSLAKDFAFSEK